MPNTRKDKIITVNMDYERFNVVQFIGAVLLGWWTYSGDISYEITLCLIFLNTDGVTVNLKKIYKAIS